MGGEGLTECVIESKTRQTHARQLCAECNKSSRMSGPDVQTCMNMVNILYRVMASKFVVLRYLRTFYSFCWFISSVDLCNLSVYVGRARLYMMTRARHEL